MKLSLSSAADQEFLALVVKVIMCMCALFFVFLLLNSFLQYSRAWGIKVMYVCVGSWVFTGLSICAGVCLQRCERPSGLYKQPLAQADG